MKIIFDFDHTLFSAKKLYLAFQKEFEKLGVEEKLFQETFQESKGRGRDYKPERQFELINKKRPEIKLDNLRKSFEKTLQKAKQFLYLDVLPALREFRKRKIEMFVLSYSDGEDWFQPKKIEKSRIRRFFKKIFITRDIYKASNFKKIFTTNKKVVFIEDNPSALFKVKKLFPRVITVRINRGEGKYALEKNKKGIDFSIKNLKELEKILKEL